MSNDENLSQKLSAANRRVNGAHVGQPVNLNVKAFKRYLSDEFPLLTKHERNSLISQYKKEAWSDYDSIVKFKLAEPTRKITIKDNDGK